MNWYHIVGMRLVGLGVSTEAASLTSTQISFSRPTGYPIARPVSGSGPWCLAEECVDDINGGCWGRPDATMCLKQCLERSLQVLRCSGFEKLETDWTEGSLYSSGGTGLLLLVKSGRVRRSAGRVAPRFEKLWLVYRKQRVASKYSV